MLQIEPTDHCNLACTMCAPHAERWETVHGIPKGYLNRALYSRILRGLVEDDLRFDHLILQWLGDPSLHPDLEWMLGEAGRVLQDRVGYVRFDSNAILLSPARMDRILAELTPGVPLTCVFTLDAVTEATYRQTKGRDGLDRARRNIRHLLARRRLLANPGQVRVQVQFVIQPSNAHEAGDFLAYWREALSCTGAAQGHGEILFKPLSVSGGAAGQAAANSLYRRTLLEAGIRPLAGDTLSVTTWEDRPWQRDDAHAARGACPGLWYTPVIRQDGHLVMCCADLHSELDLGSLAEHGFRTLWEGPRARAERQKHRAGVFDGVCRTCGGINWYTLGPESSAIG
ncbi:MAG: radical SAM/SPASM domain-containing protein [Myxococcales bacterium]|nr:radical SAM/SPASM domain-containing protein [Myxococcales bacterium]